MEISIPYSPGVTPGFSLSAAVSKGRKMTTAWNIHQDLRNAVAILVISVQRLLMQLSTRATAASWAIILWLIF